MTQASQLKVSPRQVDAPLLMDGPAVWRQYRVQYNSAGLRGVAATTGNVDFTGFDAAAMILGAFVRVGQNFAGPSIATALLSVGTVAAPVAYVPSTTVFAGAPKTILGTAQAPGTFISFANPMLSGTVRVQLIVTGANVSVLTAGWVDVLLYLSATDLSV